MATLNVKDALSYLDQVKVQFHQQPNVYNKFLDIMKDFKSQSIDTPGVIERVSTLFRGHPALIQGFNTFLPPGYRIECSTDPHEANLITVTTPTGTTTQSSAGAGLAGAISAGAGVDHSGGPSAPSAGAGGLGQGEHQHHQHQHPASHGPHGTSTNNQRHPSLPPPPPYASRSGTPGQSVYPPGGHAMTASHAQGAFANQPVQQQHQQQQQRPATPADQQHQHQHHPQPGHGPAPGLPAGTVAALQHAHPHAHAPSGTAPIGSPVAPHGISGPATPGATSGAHVLNSGLAQQRAGAAGAGTAASTTGSDGGGDGKRPPVEFNHAINYVNKIKQRFASDPDTYKAFLEILQTYQKEQRPIKDVYAQVTTLFNHAPDLLSEFKQFLPDTSAAGEETSGSQGGIFGMIGQMTSGLSQPGMMAPAGTPGRPGQEGAQAAPGGKRGQAASRKKRSALQGGEGKGAGASAGGKTKKAKHHHKGDSPGPAARGPMLPMTGAERSPTYPPPYVGAPMPPPPPGAMYGVPLPPRGAPLASMEEIAFFDRVKKHIDDRGTYHEFLKLCNLYTQDIIDVRTLVERATPFLAGSGNLLSFFKELVGYSQSKHGWLRADDGTTGAVIENVPALDRPKLDLGSCKVYGASYRKLPKSEVNLSCSGRDPMCWDVLNDTWVAHPTWAAEGEGFNSHRKNVFEDALYRCEEERHEYDFHIEANLRTIALLEPINARIAQMDYEERANFRLKPGLGGQSKSIYQRIIKKVYGRQQGLEVIQALHDNPAVAVPVVLARLKQKDEEWKRAQREWNKVWREVEARNYYKSLDHQGVNFKQTDKKSLTVKALVQEIETVRNQQRERRLAADPSMPRLGSRAQLDYVIDDFAALTDLLKLIFSFLDRSSGGYSQADRERIEQFLRHFVPLLICQPRKAFDDALNSFEDPTAPSDDAGEKEDDEAGEDDKKEDVAAVDKGADVTEPAEMEVDEKAAAPKSAIPSGDVEVDKKEDVHDAAAASPAIAGHAAEEEDGPVGEPQEATKTKTWVRIDAAGLPGLPAEEAIPTSALRGTVEPSTNGKTAESAPKAYRKNHFFGNTSFYIFIRLFHLLYHRLHRMKVLSYRLANVDPVRPRVPPRAFELGLHDPAGPVAVIDAGPRAAARYYDHLLELCEKLFDGEIDQAVFEEAVRYMYNIDGYIMFTVDKVIAQMLKMVQTILSDARFSDFLGVLERDREVEMPTYQQQIASRQQVEALLTEHENLFRFEWVEPTKTLSIQILHRDDLTIDDTQTAEDRWRMYIASYSLVGDTEGIRGKPKSPFLKRTKTAEGGEEDSNAQVVADDGLEIKVCLLTYRLFFVQGTEDRFCRLRPFEERKKLAARATEARRHRMRRFDAWLAQKTGTQGEEEKGAEMADTEAAQTKPADGVEDGQD